MSKKNFVIVGIGGHGKVILDIIQKCENINFLGFYDGLQSGGEFINYPVLDRKDIIEKKATHFIMGIGDNFVREKVKNEFIGDFSNMILDTVIHPKAVVSESAKIGEGTVVMASAVINPYSKIGKNVIVNTGSIIEHDVVIGDMSSLAPASVIGGAAKIGENVAICIGSTVLHGKKVGDHSVIGAGSLVNCDIPEFVIAYGTPCRVIRERKKDEKYL